jgi:anaerobic selenocysteine-containing dehydrogenase
VRAFQDVLLDLGARLGLTALCKEDGTPKYPGGLKDYIVNHQRRPGVGMLAGWRGNGDKEGKGEPNPNQLERYIENGCHWRTEIPDNAKFFRHANADYFDWAIGLGLKDLRDQIVLQIYSEPLRKFQLAGEGFGAKLPPEAARSRLRERFDPLPEWHPPFGEEESSAADAYPLHAITQRPMHMYHSWGSQNAWLRQIQSRNALFVNRETGKQLGLVDGDWVWIESPHGRVKAPVQLMEGVNKNTVWTWNAIGKRTGAWNLAPDAPESQKGFLLNHVISELLPPREDGYRYANADPVTGQAAWYDLRVLLIKCSAEECGETAPRFPALKPPLKRPLDLLQYGRKFRRDRNRPKRAGG